MNLNPLYIRILLWSALIFMLSCNTEPDILDAADISLTVKIDINARLDPLVSSDEPLPSLRTTSTPSSEIREYRGMILQFEADGSFLFHTQARPIEIKENNQLILPDFGLRPGKNQTLILLISPNESVLDPFSSIRSLSDFESRNIEWNGSIETDKLPMIGRLEDVSVSSYGITSTNGASVFRLKRLGSRIDFNYSFTIPGYTLTQITLHNLPKEMAVVPVENPYPILNTQDQLVSRMVTPQSQTGSFQWFIPANARGTGKNHTGDPKQKIKTNAPDNFCTYLQIECTNNLNKNEIVRFNLYLGNDAVNDFTLKYNHAYGVTANLKGFNENDLRIEGLGAMETWVEVMDLNQFQGDKSVTAVRYTSESGEVRSYPITRSEANRYYYRINNKQDVSFNSIRHIEFLNEGGNLINLSWNGMTAIESSGDTKIDYKNIEQGLYYSWIVQGIYNDAGEYEICSGRTLTNIRRLLTGRFRQVNDLALHSYASWEPIGSYSSPFRGKYLGDGYTISGMQLNQKNNSKAMGLFGAISDASLDGIRITKDNRINCLGSYVGAVVGYAYNSKISRSSNHAEITILMENMYGQNTTYTHLGGIVGYMNGGEICNTYNTGSFGAIWWYHGAGGGIVGTFNNISRSRIKSCYFTGILYGLQGSNYPVYRGGIIGVSNDLSISGNTLYPIGFMTDCYAHKERSNEVIGYPLYKDVTYLIGDYYGLANQGMKSDYFRDILNQNELVGTWMRGAENDGYPYLGIEK